MPRTRRFMMAALSALIGLSALLPQAAQALPFPSGSFPPPFACDTSIGRGPNPSGGKVRYMGFYWECQCVFVTFDDGNANWQCEWELLHELPPTADGAPWTVDGISAQAEVDHTNTAGVVVQSGVANSSNGTFSFNVDVRAVGRNGAPLLKLPGQLWVYSDLYFYNYGAPTPGWQVCRNIPWTSNVGQAYDYNQSLTFAKPPCGQTYYTAISYAMSTEGGVNRGGVMGTGVMLGWFFPPV